MITLYVSSIQIKDKALSACVSSDKEQALKVARQKLTDRLRGQVSDNTIIDTLINGVSPCGQYSIKVDSIKSNLKSVSQ